MSKLCPLCAGSGKHLSLNAPIDKYNLAHKLKSKGLSFREISKVMGLKHASQSKHYYDQYTKLNKKGERMKQIYNILTSPYLLALLVGLILGYGVTL